MVGLHRGDHRVHRSALERVHRRGPGAVDMVELRVARGEVQRAPVLQAERHLAVAHRRDLGRAAVDQAEPGIVAGPADAVARAQLDVLAAVHLDAAGAGRDPVGLPGDGPAVRALHVHRARGTIDARDAQLVALLDPEALVGAGLRLVGC